MSRVLERLATHSLRAGEGAGVVPWRTRRASGIAMRRARLFAAVTASAPVGHEAGAHAGTEAPCVFSFRPFVTNARFSPPAPSTPGATPRRRSASFGRQPRLVVEVDGASHVGRERRDRERDAYLASYGVRVLRVKAWQVERELPAVLVRIRAALG